MSSFEEYQSIDDQKNDLQDELSEFSHDDKVRRPNEHEGYKPNYLPINSIVRIFSFLSRDEVDVCRGVSKTWLNIIDTHANSLQMREIDCIELTSDHEFVVKVWYRKKVITYACKKYFGELDIDGFEVTKKHLNEHDQFDIHRDVTMPCGSELNLEFKKNADFRQWDPFHSRTCKHKNYLIYKRGRRYTKKLFTPPLAFYEQLEYLLRNCRVRTLAMTKFTFTELFVEKFLEFFPFGLSLDFLYLHNVKLRYISPETFHKFLNEAMPAKHYVLDHLDYVLPNHVNSELLKKSSIIKAQTFYVGHCTNRLGSQSMMNISPRAFYEFVTSDRLVNPQSTRDFFAIAHSTIEDDPLVINEVMETYRRDPKPSNFKYISVGTSCLRDGHLVNPQPLLQNGPQIPPHIGQALWP